MPDRRKSNRKALTVRLDPEVIQRLKQVARDAAGRPCFASVGGIVSAGILTECDRIEAILDAAIIDPAAPPAVPAPRRTARINNVEGCGPLRR